MKYQWTDEMIKFMEDAISVSPYFENLTRVILPYLDGCRNVCDAGCGTGGLAKELGSEGFNAYACDISENAIAYITKKNYKNVTPLCRNLKEWTPKKKFDAMVFNYFGRIEEILEISRRCCSGKVIIVKKSYAFHRFSFGQNPITERSASSAEEYIKQKNITYKKQTIELEFGQPFRKLEDAVRFFEIYSKDEDKSLIMPGNVKKKLVPYAQGDFKYYLPQKKSSVVFVLD